MKKLLIISLLTITLFTLTGCDKKEEIKGIDTCPNCVFNYYHFNDYAWQDNNTIGHKSVKYFKDYKELKDENGNQREIFYGYVVDKEDMIERLFVCSFVDEKPYCIEATSDGSKYESNKSILNKLYTDCFEEDDEFYCDNYYVANWKDGFIGIANEKIMCSADSNDAFCKDRTDE